MAESDWDTVTVLRKKGPTTSQAKSKQVSPVRFFGAIARSRSDRRQTSDFVIVFDCRIAKISECVGGGQGDGGLGFTSTP